MGDIIIPISVPADNEGYVTFQCPFCSDMFKLKANEVQAEEVTELFCPYCGLISDANRFQSDSVLEHCQTVAKNHAKDLVNNFMKDWQRKSRGTFKVNKLLKKEEPKILFEVDNDLEPIILNCCDKASKVRSKEAGVYCPYCGVKE